MDSWRGEFIFWELSLRLFDRKLVAENTVEDLCFLRRLIHALYGTSLWFGGMAVRIGDVGATCRARRNCVALNFLLNKFWAFC